MVRSMLILTLALANGGQVDQASQQSGCFELYSNFDISHLIRPNMNWYELLDIRQQLRRPSLGFYVDKIQYKNRMKELGIDIPEIYYAQNVEPDMHDTAFDDIFESIEQVLDRHSDYVAKPTHMSCSDHVYVVKDGYNIYPKSPQRVENHQVASNLTQALRSRSSLLGESWALHQVSPGVIIEERISAGGADSTAALEFKTIVIWGQVWAADVRRGTDAVQVLGRDGRDLLDHSIHPSLSHVDWPRVRDLAERLGAHKDCFRVDIFVSPASRREPGTLAFNQSSVMKYQVSEVEFYITSSLPLFDEAAKLWLDGYKRSYVLIPNPEVSRHYSQLWDPDFENERAFFTDLKLQLGWAESSAESRTYGSRAPRRMQEEVARLGSFEAHGNLSAALPCNGKAWCPTPAVALS